MPAPVGSVFQTTNVFQPTVFQKGASTPPATNTNPPIVYMMANMGSLMGR